MNIKYEVILTAKAKKELYDIYNYISKTLIEEKIAKKIISKIEKDILRLEDMPESCSKIKGCKFNNIEYRKLIIKNYVAIYRVDIEQHKVYIVRIVYGGRNYLNDI